VSEAAALRDTGVGLVPQGTGWFVVNAREAGWHDASPFGFYCAFEGEQQFAQLGINLNVLQPGESNGLYHREGTQEDFLILAGECLLLIEDEQRLLRAWDFAHSPPGTDHILVGAGNGPCLFLSVGARPGRGAVFPVSDVARKHEVGVARETTSAEEAYAPYRTNSRGAPTQYHYDWLPDL
jgi:uncharacterized cupin superfamily protein